LAAWLGDLNRTERIGTEEKRREEKEREEKRREEKRREEKRREEKRREEKRREEKRREWQMGWSPSGPDAPRPFSQALCAPQTDVQSTGPSSFITVSDCL